MSSASPLTWRSASRVALQAASPCSGLHAECARMKATFPEVFTSFGQQQGADAEPTRPRPLPVPEPVAW